TSVAAVTTSAASHAMEWILERVRMAISPPVQSVVRGGNAELRCSVPWRGCAAGGTDGGSRSFPRHGGSGRGAGEGRGGPARGALPPARDRGGPLRLAAHR